MVWFAGERDVYFVADSAIQERDHIEVILGNSDLLFLTLPQQDITELHKRWYQLQDKAIEIFLNSGRTCLLTFPSTQVSTEKPCPCYYYLYTSYLLFPLRALGI